MEHKEADEHTSLRPDETTPSDFSMGSTPTVVTSPSDPSALHQRQSYHRVSSFQEEDIAYHGAEPTDEDNGLGIQNLHDTKQGPSIEVSFDNDSPSAPGSAGFLLSPAFTRSQSTKKYRALEDTPEEEGDFRPEGRSRSPSLFRQFTADSETDGLRRPPARNSTLSPYGPTGTLSLISFGNFYGDSLKFMEIRKTVSKQRETIGADTYFIGGEHPDFTCTTKQHFHHARGELPSILVLMASAFSTVFSAIWLGLAAGKPHYGSLITHNSQLPPATASLLVAAFAKSIELTFVTSFVAFLGQLLSQRAFRKSSNGITVAEMQMRTWILQPGTLITHAPAVRYAALTVLGALAMFAALLAIFYTTASDALGKSDLQIEAQLWQIDLVIFLLTRNSLSKTQIRSGETADDVW